MDGWMFIRTAALEVQRPLAGLPQALHDVPHVQTRHQVSVPETMVAFRGPALLVGAAPADGTALWAPAPCATCPAIRRSPTHSLSDAAAECGPTGILFEKHALAVQVGVFRRISR